MPIAPRFHSECIRMLTEQILKESHPPRLEQMKLAEKLLKEISDDSLYPFDYITYRITDFRVDASDQPVLLGSALLGDLVALIAVVSRTLNLPAGDTLNVNQAANRLHTSTRTLSRLRHEGLVFHWVLERSSRWRLGCSVAELDDFKNRNKQRIKQASTFSRLSSDEKQEIVQLAMQCTGDENTLSEVAAKLAKNSVRGHETIRLLLQTTQSTVQKFQQTRRLTRNDAREIEKELQLGTTWEVLTNRYQRTIGTMRKSLLRLRATRLKQLNITHVELDVFSRDDAEDVILGAASAQQVYPPVLLLDSLEFNRKGNIVLGEETGLVSAMHLLRRRASVKSKLLGYSPTEKIIDRIETDLRWSFLLQQKLIVEAMPSALAVAVQHIGRPLHELPLNQLVSLVRYVIQVVGVTCAKLDPSTGQSVFKTPAAVLDRSLPLIKTDSKPLRAAAKYKAIELRCPFHQSVSWTKLIPTEHLPENAKQISSELEHIVSLRFGWFGRPRTIQEISSEINKSSVWVATQLRGWS